MTSKLEVAIDYSGASNGKTATVLAVRLSQVDSGACLIDFSQYPAELEYLWLALSYIQPIKGKEEFVETPHGLVRLIYVKVNANGKTRTIEELLNVRRDLHLATVKQNELDISQILTVRNDLDKKLKDQVLSDFGELLQRHKALDASVFNEDLTYRKCVTELLDFVNFAHAAIDLGNDPAGYDGSYPSLRGSHREMVQKASGKLKQAEAGSAASRQAALEYCQRIGVLKDLDSLEILNEKGETLLMQSAADGQLLHVKLLIKAGANLLAIDTVYGDTALTWAANQGHAECVRELLAASVDANSANWYGWCGLVYAATYNHPECIRELLAAGADISAKCQYNEFGETALQIAQAKGHKKCVELLGGTGSI